MANAGTLTVDLQANIASFQSGMKQATSAIESFQSQISGIASTVTGFLDKIPVIGGALGGAFALGNAIEQIDSAQRSVAKLEAVVRSAGYAGTGAAHQLEQFASSISKSTRFSGG